MTARHRLWGRLFGDRYKAVLVEARAGYYYETLLDYIHLNPARCGLVGPRRKQSILDIPGAVSLKDMRCLRVSDQNGWLGRMG